jgi:hypothetical protein
VHRERVEVAPEDNRKQREKRGAAKKAEARTGVRIRPPRAFSASARWGDSFLLTQLDAIHRAAFGKKKSFA